MTNEPPKPLTCQVLVALDAPHDTVDMDRIARTISAVVASGRLRKSTRVTDVYLIAEGTCRRVEIPPDADEAMAKEVTRRRVIDAECAAQAVRTAILGGATLAHVRVGGGVLVLDSDGPGGRLPAPLALAFKP